MNSKVFLKSQIWFTLKLIDFLEPNFNKFGFLFLTKNFVKNYFLIEVFFKL